jgi:glutathione peroxidase
MTAAEIRVPERVLAELHPEALGQTLLIVNVASQCGFTKQYSALEALHRRYSGDGLLVLGIPCNQFGGQEPGTDTEIQDACRLNWGVTFPVMPRADVNGDQRLPVYEFLVQSQDDDGETGDVRWNFEKFLLDHAGHVVRRFRPHIEPNDPDIQDAVASLLASLPK